MGGVGQRALLVAVLVALAGCNVGLDDRQETREPFGVPPDSDPVRDRPPGLSTAGTVDPGRLARAHARTLYNYSYTHEANTTVRYPNGSLHSRTTVTVWTMNRESRFALDSRSTLTRPPVRSRRQVWSDSVTARYRITDGNATVHRTERLDSPGTPIAAVLGYDPTHRDRLARVFAAVDVDTVERLEDGSVGESTLLPPLYRLRATSIERPSLLGHGPVEATHDGTLTAVVDARGIVYRYRLTYEGRLDGQPVALVRTVRYRNVGTTVVAGPPWEATPTPPPTAVDRARPRVTDRPADGSVGVAVRWRPPGPLGPNGVSRVETSFSRRRVTGAWNSTR